MRIGIDIRCFSEGKRTGVEEYALNLLGALWSIDQKNSYILFANSFGKSKIDLKQFERYPNVKLKLFRFPNKLLNFCFWYFGWPHLDRMLGGVDFLFLPNMNFASWSSRVKTIITVHDLSFIRYPETFSWKRRLWHFLVNPRKLCQKADHVIAVSDSTAHDLAEKFGVMPGKINRIYSAVSEEIRVVGRNDLELISVKDRYDLPYRFILNLGTIEPRKNIVSLIRAYEKLRALNNPEIDKYKLVIAGQNGWKSKKIFSTIQDSPYADDILVIGPLPPRDKVYLLNLASVFVYPSLFEGFGFPPLEAMQAGVPVIASNNSSLPEIMGDAGIMIDPDRPDEIFGALQELLLNRDLQELLRLKGLERAKKFSWEKSAREFLEVIRAVAKK